MRPRKAFEDAVDAVLDALAAAYMVKAAAFKRHDGALAKIADRAITAAEKARQLLSKTAPALPTKVK